MVKKAQLKVFAIITCILLAIFIAVLGSVNLIMQAVMQRQSKDVLKKIAAGVEYNDSTHQFMISRPENFGQKPARETPPPSEPPSQPAAQTTLPPSSEVATEASEEETTDITEISTEAAVTAAAIPDAQRQETQAELPPTEEPQQNEAPAEPTVSAAATAPVVTQSPTVTAAHTAPATQPTQPQATAPQPATKGHQEPTKARQEPTEPATQPNQYQNQYQYPQGPYPYDPNWNNGNGWCNPYWGDPNQQQQQWDYWNKYWEEYWKQFNNNGGKYYAPYSEGTEPVSTECETTTAEVTTTVPDCAQYYNPYYYPYWCAPYPTANEISDNTPSQLGLYKQSENEGLAYISDINNEGRERREPMDESHQTLDQIPKSLGSIDFFIVMADKDGNFLASINNDDLNDKQAQDYISAILKENLNSGMIENKYQFYKTEKNNGTIMVFTDKGAEMNMLNKLIRTTILIGTISLIVLAAASFFLSRKVMQPLKTAFEKQKQFISDASHELKTPLTVISANADVLTGEIGENRWLTYIKSQTDRMNVLVNDLLNLTRLENNSSNFVRTDFDLSKAIINTALPFECQAFESNKKFDVDVESGLSINGSELHIKQMAAIFIDNALKYSGDGGTVKVSLKKAGDKKVFSVYNTGQGIKEEEKDKLFERFYRSDQSRNRATGGYGLGLAIAKSIIDKHKFKIHIENEEGKSVRFVVTM